MVTPLMLLLSSINENYAYDRPVDIMYMSSEDRQVIMSEAERLGKLASDDTRILTTIDVTGRAVADTTQLVNGKVVEINPVTAALLTRIREAYQVYRNSNVLSSVEQSGEDLSADTVILRLEGNPKYVYIYVYETMEIRGLSYIDKIKKLNELYVAILTHSGVRGDIAKANALRTRFELQSTIQFWQSLLTADLIRQNLSVHLVTEQDILTAKDELRQLGFYGFVNPLSMYLDFSGARVNRKLEVNIADEVIDFLGKVIRSSGVVMQEETA